MQPRKALSTLTTTLWGLAAACLFLQEATWAAAARDRRRQIFIAGFFPMNTSDGHSDVGHGVLPAVELALTHINDNEDVLPDYYLNVYWNDTQCNAAVGLKALFDMMDQPPAKLMLFGAACTQVTDPIAKTSKFWYLTQLSYADTHPMFSRHNYPYLFRVVPSENEFNAPRVELLRRFNWTLVGTLFQNEPRYALAHNKLINDIDDALIQIKTTQSFTDDLGNCLLKLKAYRLHMYGRNYQWIIVSMYGEQWWEKMDKDLPCTRQQMMQAMEGHIATDLLPLRSNNVTTRSGLNAQEYKEQYDKQRNKSYSRFHGFAYDGIWTVALAIEAVSRKLEPPHRKSFALDDFQYRNKYWGELFLDALNKTSFEGVTGTVRFVNNDRQGYVLLKQFQNGKEVKIGEYDALNTYLDLSKGSAISWHGGSSPPRDRTLIIIERYRISLTVYAILATMASMGIIVATIFLAINIKFRNHRYIKMSSPYLNNLIIIGCILTYTSIILLGLDSELVSVQSLPFICTVRAWVLMAGFTLAFGSMFSKTWRVHAIFTNIKLNKKVIKDYQLFIVVGILLAIDLAIMTTWQVVDPFYRETMRLKSYVHPSYEDRLITPELEFCKSDKMTVFMVTVYAYKGLLMIIGCFLAWETRHVSIPALNDSKYVGMSVYNVVIMCVMGAAISFLLSEQQNASFILISAFIIFCSTTTLCLVFVPKLVELKRNPNGSDKRSRTTFKPSTRKRYDSEDSDVQERIKQLQEENQKCRKTLREKDLELQALLKQLGENAQDVFGSDIRERTRPGRRTDLMVRSRNGEFIAVDDDMNSVMSISSSPDGETTMTTMDTYIERKRPSFSSNLCTIMASTETIGAAAAKLLEAITFEPMPSIADSTLSDQQQPENEEKTTPEVDDDDDDEPEDHYETQLLPSRRPSQQQQQQKQHNQSHSSSKSDSDSDDGNNPCTVSTGSPTLHLRRAFSWGRKGYIPMGNNRKRLPMECYLLDPPVPTIKGVLGNDIGEAPSSIGSWPNIARKSSPSLTTTTIRYDFDRLSTVENSTSLPRQISEKNRTLTVNVTTAKSYSNIKCDVVEYL